MAIPGGNTYLNPLFQVLTFAVGVPIGTLLQPPLQDFLNDEWDQHPSRPLNALEAAAMQVEGIWTPDRARQEANWTGINNERFDALAQLFDDPPAIERLYTLWRRKEIDGTKFIEGLKHHRIETDYFQALRALKDERLDPADIARGIHRGLVPDPGLLEGELPSGVGNVPAYPIYDIHALDEAAAAGLDRDRLGVLVGLQGNPMGAHEAAQARFRGILNRNDYLRAIAEGNTRNEWADAIFEQSRQIPTAREFLENALRGYRTLAEALAGAARHGMSVADATMVYQNQGRPMAVAQITRALARGGTFKPEPGEIKDPYLASIVEGNLKPAYYDLAMANRYTYPSFFAIRGLLQAGVLDADETYQILLEMGWRPDLARKVADFYGAVTTGGTGPLVKSAVTQAVTEIRSAYLIGQADDGQARGWLGALGVTALDQDGLLKVWNVMREVPQKGLTAAQIKKAARTLPERWPRARALDELQQTGLTASDAADYLDE